MATVLTAGDIAVVQYNSGTTDSFSFVFARDVEAGTVVNFTDNGWLAAGGFRPGEGTVTYTAPTAITGGTIITLTGLNLDDAGDQIIAYQGDPTTPTILYLVDLADGNNTVAGDATNDNTTALPPDVTLGQNAVAVGFDNAIYAGPIDGSPPQLFPLISNSANWINSDALPPSARYFYPPHLDLDSNNSTSGGDDYRAEVTNDSTPVSISDTDSDIDDFDGGFITFAQFNIKNQFPGDVLSVNGTLPFGIFATPFDPFTGILTLYGFASHSAYQTAIEQVQFSTDAPVGVVKSIGVWVFDDFWWSNEATAIFTVTSAAAPPVLDLDANNSNGGGADYTATFTNGGAAIPVADTDVSITDADSTTIQSASITIAINRQSGDELSAGALPPGITASSYNPFTGVITLSGAASLADYQTALRQVVFDTTSISTADRIIRVTVNDGTFDSNVGTTYMHVVVPPPNIPPALDLDANNSTTPGANYLTGFTDGGPAVAIVDTDVLVTDSDDTELTSATVTLTNHDTDDVLVFNGAPPPGITASVYNPATGILTLTGTASLAAYQTALQQITFDNTGTTPSTATRVIGIVVNDGASNSNTAHSFIQVEVVNNSAPVLDLDPNDSGGSFRSTFRNAFTENGAPVPIADVDTSITDADSTHLESATITLTNPQTGDLLTVSGVLPGTITPTAYNPGTGVLTLTGHATLDEYETALKQILYSNTSNDPVTGDRLIEVVVNDGANNSNLAGAIISVTATNDAPVITVDPSAAYVENAAAVVLDPTAALSDVDDIELHGALVSITDGSFPGDGDILSVGGVTSNTVNGITFVWMPAQHALVFSGASSVANYQALLRQVQFQSSSDNPTDFGHSPLRTLTWAVTDSASVTTTTTTINIVAVNDAPQETVAAAAAYTENGSPVTISSAATASDVDSSDLIYGGVRIVAGGFDGDVLTVNGLQSGTFAGIDFSYDAGLRRLLFDSPAAVADYQALMQAVEFGSTSENPTNFGANPTRTLAWGLFDGEDYSSPAQTTQITITALNDAPINTVPGAQSVAEDSILPIAGVSVADIDSSALATTLSVSSGKLNVIDGLNVTGNGTASVSITGTAAQINAALAGLAYTGNPNFNGADILTVATNDGTAIDTDTIAITVNPVNDPPVLNLDLDSSTIGGVDYLTTFTDGGPAVPIVDTDVSVVDIDSPLLASATVTLTNPQASDSLTFNGSAPGSIIVLGSGTSVITLTGAASAADYQTALRQITFDNPDTNPSTETRIIDVVVNDGTAASNTAQAIVEVTQVNNSAPVVDLDADDSTVVRTSFRGTFTEGGSPIPIADIDTLITDADSTTLASATITLTNPQAGDLLAASGALPGGITASSYDPGTGILTLSGVASLADYETALEAIRFSAAGENPVAGSRIVEVVVNDGANNSQAVIALLTVVAVNDPPINTVPGAQTVAEDTILAIAGVSVADIDSSALTTTLSVAHGILNVTAGPGVTGNGTASVTIAGTAAQINAALAGLAYTGNLNFNGADTLTVATGDGAATDTDTIAITVNPVNDAPTNSVPGGQTVAEDTLSPIAGVSVADIDSSALTTTLSVANGILNVTAGPGVAGNGTASVTIAGTAAQINAALAGLAYAGNSNFNGADTLTVATSDATSTDTDTIAITVNPVNDAPINTVVGGQTVAEDTILPIVGVSVADIDSSALTTTLNVSSGKLHVIDGLGAGVTGNGTASVTITGTAAQINAALVGLAYTGNLDFNGADTLTVATSDGIAIDTDTIAITVNPVNDPPALDLDANNSTTPGANYLTGFTEGGLPVAIADTDVSIIDSDSPTLASATITLTNPQALDTLTFNGAAPGSIVVSGSGTNIITLTGASSQADYQAALHQIEFGNGSINPSNVTRVINIVVNDGVTNSNTAKAFVQVEAVNNAAPVVDLDPNDSGGSFRSTFRTTFTENGAAVAIADIDTTIADADSTNLVSATITLTNPHTGDLLAVSGALPGGIIDSVYNPVTGVLTLTGSATLAQYEAALQQIQFSNTGDDPVTDDRLIEVIVNDGANDSNVAAAVIGVAAVNDAPALTVASATYQENAPPVFLSPAASVTDLDDTQLNLAAVQITAGSFPGDGDTLTVNGATSGAVTGITFTWNPTLHALILSGTSLVANYQALLQTVQFQSTSDNPTDFNTSPQRTLTWLVSDGTAVTTATTTLDIVALNDPAVAQDDAVATTENAVKAGNVFANNGSDVDSDPDGGAFLVTAVSGGTLGAQFALPSGALLTLNANGTFSYDPNHLFDYLPTPGSGASNLTVTDTFTYTITGGDTATVTVTVSGVDTDDTLLDSAGHDNLAGGSGDDFYYVTNPADVVIENAGEVVIAAASAGSDTVVASVTYTLPASNTIEVLNMLGAGLTGTGSDGAETLISTGGPNTLVGLGGDDYYYLYNTADVVIEAASGGSDTVAASVNYTLSSNLEVLNMLGSGLTGTGTGGAETLISTGGPNTLVGLGGNDSYYVHNTADVVVEAPGGGSDTVAASVNYTMPANVEVLNMVGSGLTGTGSGGADTLMSTGGPNTLIGLGGNDYYYVNNTADVVTEAASGGSDTVVASANYTLPANVEVLNMAGSGLTGTGSGGADTLMSTGGPNTLIGLGGDDYYYVYNSADVVVEAAGGGSDTVAASVNYTLPANVEVLNMVGSGLTGTGTGGADTLMSTGGANTLIGLGGDDLYYVNNSADVVTEAANGGYDTVMASVSYTLSANVEAMYVTGSGLTGTGSSGNNTLASIGANTLVGGGGSDMFVFFSGSANAATVADFARSEGDILVFSGFGTEAQGAAFSQIGTTDQWQIHSGLDAHNETITFSNHAALLAGDWAFV